MGEITHGQFSDKTLSAKRRQFDSLPAVGTAVRDELATQENSSLPLHLEIVSFSYRRKLRPLWTDNRLFVRLKCSVPSSVSPHRGTRGTEIPRVF